MLALDKRKASSIIGQKLGYRTKTTTETPTTESVEFLNVGTQRKALLGSPIYWTALPQLAGPTLSDVGDRSAVIIYAHADEAPMVVDALEHLLETFKGSRLTAAAVVDGPYATSEETVPVLRGAPPGPATTYLVGPRGKVRFETMGMPPVQLVRDLLKEVE